LKFWHQPDRALEEKSSQAAAFDDNIDLFLKFVHILEA
jgi:hypothetical protein